MKVKVPIIVGVVIVLLVVGIAAYMLWRPEVKLYTLNIWTGGTGGVYYPLGVKLSEMLNKY
ncbi:MAG: hypothetical protein QXQ86_05085, partial [Sulfolobales archaeon]